MVKVEPYPYQKELMFVQKITEKIQSILPKDHKISWDKTSLEEFIGRIEIEREIIEDNFFITRKVNFHSTPAEIVVLKPSTMQLFLFGNEDELMYIAQKFEENGYDVTIWTRW